MSVGADIWLLPCSGGSCGISHFDVVIAEKRAFLKLVPCKRDFPEDVDWVDRGRVQAIARSALAERAPGGASPTSIAKST